MANGKILCAQIAMTLYDIPCVVTCRNASVHIYSFKGFEITSRKENWQDWSFEGLRYYLEQELEALQLKDEFIAYHKE